MWADGVYFKVRLEDPGNARQCTLVLIGATAEGKKELIAVTDGYRESEQSWVELQVEVKSRGLERGPRVATGDGAMGFWGAMRKVYPGTREQLCWVHKTANILNKIPKGLQARAKGMLHEIWMAETKEAAERAFDVFVTTSEAKYPKAVGCLEKYREKLLTFCDFPAEHWIHLRTTNPIESTFSTVRLRTDKGKGCGSQLACLTMVFKLALSVEKHRRTLNGSHLIRDVVDGVTHVDGVRAMAA